MVILAFVLDVAYIAAVVNDWLAYWQVLGRFAIPPLRPFFEGLTYGNPGLVAAMAVLALDLGQRAAGRWDRAGRRPRSSSCGCSRRPS